MARNRTTDRRVHRTRTQLHEALASLIHEKSYDDIVVKEILTRADVGRSTFYSHFGDKTELLVSGIRDMLGELKAKAPTSASVPDRILAFSLPLLQHIERQRQLGGANAAAHGHAAVHQHLEKMLVEMIAHDLTRLEASGTRGGTSVPRDLIARHVAGTFVLTLNWWLQNSEPMTAQRANALFRMLVLPTLASALD